MSAALPPPSEEQLHQLRRFAKAYGRRWRHMLLFVYWPKADPLEDFPGLYALRNSHGPSWLSRFRLPKQL